MGIKFLVIALVAVLSLQGFADAKHVDIINASYINKDDLIQLIKALIEKIHEAVEEAIQKFETIIAELGDEIKGKIEELIKEFGINIEEIKKEIEAVIAAAKELGEKSKECVEAQESNLTALHTKTTQALNVCAEPIKIETHALIKVIVEGVKKVKEIVGRVFACRDPLCLVGAITHAITELTKVSQVVEKTVVNFIKNIEMKLPAAKVCVAKAADEFETGIEAIRTEIKECVNKYGNSSA